MKVYDLIVIGGGAAAFSAVLKARELGAKVALAEKGILGGTCVNVGCVPSKHLLSAAEHYHELSKVKHAGIIHQNAFVDFKKIVENKNRLVNGLRKSKYEDLLKGSGADFYPGTAEFISKSEIMAAKRILKGRNFVIATGSSTSVPAIIGIEKVNYLTNIEALNLKHLPKSMIVVGGGALGLEFAQMFARFGTKVTVLQNKERILPREEPEVSEALHKLLQKEGIQIYLNASVKEASQKGSSKEVKVLMNGKIKMIKAEVLLIAAGRTPNSGKMGLEKAGVNTGKKGEIVVDDYLRSSSQNIYAAGDVLGEPMLETVAGREGGIASENALRGNIKKMDFSVIPHAVFTDPQVASVGLTDAVANKMGYSCSCRVIGMEKIPKAIIIGDTRGLIKMVADNKTKRILGVSILAPMASEMIHEAAMMLKNKMTVDDAMGMVHVFPTLSEAIKTVAQSYYKDIDKLSCCVE